MSLDFMMVRKHAATRAERHALVWALMRSWDRCPHLRLGQLLDSVLVSVRADLFCIEDSELVEATNVFARDRDSSDDYVEPPEPPTVMRLGTPDYGDGEELEP